MAGTRRREWYRQIVRRHAAAGLVALLLAAAGPAAAGEFNLLLTSSANLTGGTVGGQSTSQHNFTQSADMNYNRTVTPLLSYRLRLRGSDNESTTSSASTSTSSTNRFLEPAVDMTLAGTKFSLDGGVRLRQTFVGGTQAQPLTLTENNEFLRASFTPDLLPAFNFQVERTASTDDRKPTTLDRSETRVIFGATYILAQKVNLAYTLTNQTGDDNVAKRTQEQRSHVGTANYSDTFFADRLSVDANYLFNRLDTTERFAPVAAAGGGGGPLLLPVVLSGAFALTESDPTVAAASKVPPVMYATLTNVISSTLGIFRALVANDGGTPNKNASIAFGLTPGASITTVRLTISPRAGDPRDISLQAQGVTFQVFAGANPQINQTGWTAVPIASVTPPTAINPFFEIAFAAAGGSFVKIYLSGDTQQPPGGALGPLTATAITAFASTAAGGAGAAASGRLTTGNLLQSLTGGIMVRPLTALTLNANATYSTNKQDTTGRQDNTGTYSLTATGTPHRLLTATGVYQASFTTSSDPQAQRTDTRLASITLSSTPLPTLTASLSGTRSENLLGGVLQTQTTSVGFNTALKPYRGLNVDLSSSTSQSQNFVDGTQTSGFSASLNANALLTPRLTGLFGVTLSTSEVTGGAAPASVTSSSTFLSLTYTISRFLNAGGRWDLSVSAGNYTLTQQYRLDLIPTSKTSILFSFLRTDQQSSAVSGGGGAPGGGTGTSGSTNAATVTARWNISRYLDVNVTTNLSRGFTGDTTYGISGTLAFRL